MKCLSSYHWMFLNMELIKIKCEISIIMKFVYCKRCVLYSALIDYLVSNANIESENPWIAQINPEILYQPVTTLDYNQYLQISSQKYSFSNSGSHIEFCLQYFSSDFRQNFPKLACWIIISSLYDMLPKVL